MTEGNVRSISEANARQVGGDHYQDKGGRTGGLQHWDIVDMFNLDYFQGAITKYVFRWKRKDGVKDLRKAQHFLEKYISLAELSELFAEAAKDDTLVPEKLEAINDKIVAMPEADVLYTFAKGEVTPTGWVQFVFEGANAEGFLFTCRECGAKFYAQPQTNPHAAHTCHAIATQACDGEATAAYVNQ